MAGQDTYDAGDAMDSEGIPDIETPINQDEGVIAPRDYPQAVEEYGTTANEQRTDEPLSQRLLREEPDFDSVEYEASMDATDRADDGVEIGGLVGRLLEPGSEDVDAIDDEKDLVATASYDDEDGLSAEESAMHITESP